MYFLFTKFQFVSCNLSLAMIWQMTYTHKLPKLCSSTLIFASKQCEDSKGCNGSGIARTTCFLSLPSHTSIVVFEGHAKMRACSYCHATYTNISWQRSERQNDRSQLILVLTQANANDRLCIRPFCTLFKHCCKLTSALRYRALFWRVQVINKRCRFHYVQWSYWSTWMMNASLIRGILFVVTRSLLSGSLKI